MKQKNHRIVALLLVLVMCLSLLPSAALADNDYKTIQYYIGSTTAKTLTQSEFQKYSQQYGLCTLTRVIQWSGKNTETLTNLVLKGQKMALTKPTASTNMTFGNWTYSDGTTFSGSITKDTTIYLKEVKLTTYQVTFNLGGASGTAPATQTVVSGATAKKPTDPTWTGYKFLGWYTSGGAAWNFSSPVTGNLKLTAKWSAVTSGSGQYTVTLNANGGTGVYTATQKVASGKSVTLPTTLTMDGYYLEGWYDANGTKYTSSTPITSNCTLTAKWVKDTFSFGNVKLTSGTQYFNSTYNISQKYLEYLKTGESSSVRYSTGETIEFKEYIQRNAERTWNGSCFGMAAVYCLSNAGRINANAFQSGARGLIDLKYPSQSTATNDLVNFYYLTQFTYSITKQFNSNSKLTTAGRNTMVINAMKASDGYVLLTFSYGKGSGHAVVGTGYTIKDGYCVISIWNPNYPTAEGTLQVPLSGDTKPTFTTGTKGATTYNVNLKFTGAFTVNDCTSTYDAKNLQQYITSTKSTSSATAKSTDFAVLTTSVAAFSLTTEDGSTAVIEDGDVTSGNMNIQKSVVYGGEDDDFCTFFLDAEDAADLEVDTYGQDADIQLLANGQYSSVTADGLDSVVFDGTSVRTSCAIYSQQTISISSDLFGDTWNKVTVTGTDTGLQVSPESGGVKILSNNDISVSIQGTNVDSQLKTTAQTVEVSPAGVTVSTTSGSMKADPSTVSSTFVDVDSDAYYYDAVMWAAANNITNGSGADTFSPEDTVIRADAVTFLWRAYGRPEPSSMESPFTDVTDQSAYYYKAVLWAAEQGITNGIGGNQFGLRETLSYDQILGFLCRAAGGSAVGENWSEDALNWAESNGLTDGLTYTAKGDCPRSDTVYCLWMQLG